MKAVGLLPPYLQVLRSQQQRPLNTVRELCYALAELGGHLDRASNRPPGWQTLRRGLRQLVKDARLAAPPSLGS